MICVSASCFASSMHSFCSTARGLRGRVLSIPLNGILVLMGLFLLPAAHAQTVVNVPVNGSVPYAVAVVCSQGGGTVNIPAGTFAIPSSMQVCTNLTVSGAGSSTILQLPQTPNSIAMFSTSSGVQNVTIENLVMDGNAPKGAMLLNGTGGGNPYGNTGIYMFDYNGDIINTKLTNVEIKNFGEIGILMGTANGVYLNGVNLHDNNYGNFSHNAYLVACDNVNISHSYLDHAHLGDGLHIDFGGVNTTINKSEFSNNHGLGILTQGNPNVTIENTRTDHNANDGIQTDASGLYILQDEGSFNGGYGVNIPDTADGNGHLNGYFGEGNNPDIAYFYQVSVANFTSNNGLYGNNNVYEAENATGVLGPVDTADWTTAYAGFTGVGAVDFNANHLSNGLLTFNGVGAPSTGTFAVSFRYSNGSSGPQSMKFVVNGATLAPLTFPATGSYSAWGTISVNVPLMQGNNVLQISPTGSSAPEIDNMSVAATNLTSLGPVTNLTGTAVSPYQVNLSWTAPAGAATYSIIRTGANGSPIVALHITGTTWTDSDILFGNSAYTYSVYSEAQGVGGSAASVTVQTPIDTPAGLQASSGPTISTNWMSANGAASYNLKRAATSAGPFNTIASIKNTTSLFSTNSEQSYSDSSCVANTTYSYVVSAVDSNGNESPNSYAASAFCQGAPSFSLTMASPTINLLPGNGTTDGLNVVGINGFSGTVSFATSALASGINIAFSPSTTASSTAFVVYVQPGTVPGSYPITITGTSGSLTAMTQVTVVVGGTQTITFGAIPAQTALTKLGLTATASSGLVVSYTASPASVCTVSGSTASFVGSGSCTITASQSGNSSYSAANPVSQTFTVNGAAQTISFTPPSTANVGTSATVTATASSGLPVTFSVVPNGNCSVSGNVVSFLNVGNCGVLANQGGNGIYAAAPQNGQIIVVNQALTAQTISFPSIATQTALRTLALTAKATSGLTVSYAASPSSVCAVTGSTASFAAAGSCMITASQAGNGSYSAAAPVSQSFTVNPAAQTITFNAIPPQKVNTTYTVSATASSGLPVSFSLVPNGNCSISGNAVTLLNTGNCGVIASQAGNGTYAAAAAVGQVIVVGAGQLSQTITFNAIASQKVGSSLTVSATASSGLPVRFSLVPNGNCSISGNVVTLLNTGNCGVLANQSGNASYTAAPQVGQIIVVHN